MCILVSRKPDATDKVHADPLELWACARASVPSRRRLTPLVNSVVSTVTARLLDGIPPCRTGRTVGLRCSHHRTGFTLAFDSQLVWRSRRKRGLGVLASGDGCDGSWCCETRDVSALRHWLLVYKYTYGWVTGTPNGRAGVQKR